MIPFLQPFFKILYDTSGLIQWGGLTAIFIIVFAETGLFFGFFLPGDSLLITAGVLAAAGYLNLLHLIVLATIAAILGDQTGYAIGRQMGKMLFRKKDSFLFKHEHLEKAKEFYDKHGGKTILVARFIPIIRTFAPPVAGASEMKYRTFVIFNILGGMFWVLSTVLGGYFLGKVIPNLEHYINLVIFIVVFVSFIPIAIEYLRRRKK